MRIVSFMILALIFYFFPITISYAQEEQGLEQELFVSNGHWGDALNLSFLPDNNYVGVLIQRDENYRYSTEQIIHRLKSYFDFYNLPVKFVLQDPAEKGNLCTIRVYIDGRSIWSELSNGNWTLNEIRENHENVFKKLQAVYTNARTNND